MCGYGRRLGRIRVAGSWIGTRAGTGGELNKHGKVEEAAENNEGAGEATEGK